MFNMSATKMQKICNTIPLMLYRSNYHTDWNISKAGSYSSADLSAEDIACIFTICKSDSFL